MKTRFLLLAFITTLFFTANARAVPAPTEIKSTIEPAVMVQVKSIAELLDTLKTTTKRFLPDDKYKSFEKELLGELGPDAVKGIDAKKPLGLYATLGKGVLAGDFSTSFIVAIVPVTDEKEFVALLTKMDFKPTKKGDGYSLLIPRDNAKIAKVKANVPFALGKLLRAIMDAAQPAKPDAPIEGNLQFSRGYAYISGSPEAIEPKNLVSPDARFFEKATAAAMLKVRFDRLPDDLKAGVLEMMGDRVARHLHFWFQPFSGDDIPPEKKAFSEDVVRTYRRMTKMGVDEGKELTVSLDLDPKTGAVILDSILEAKNGTALAKSFNAIAPTKNDFASIVGPDSAGHFLFQAPLLTEDVRKLVSKAIELDEKHTNANAGPVVNKARDDAMAEVYKAFRRTVEGGNLDLAISLRGPDKNEQYTVVGALGLKDTEALVKSLRKAIWAAALKDKEVANMLKIDVFKVDGISVHEFTLPEQGFTPEAMKIFGKRTGYIALKPNAVLVTFGANAKDVMKEVLTQKLGPKPAPLIQVEVSGKRLMPLIKHIGFPPDDMVGQFFRKLAEIDQVSVFACKVEAGENKLKVRLELGLDPLVGWLGIWTVAQPPMAQPQIVPAIQKK